jgi:hypothetical protein
MSTSCGANTGITPRMENRSSRMSSLYMMALHLSSPRRNSRTSISGFNLGRPGTGFCEGRRGGGLYVLHRIPVRQNGSVLWPGRRGMTSFRIR